MLLDHYFRTALVWATTQRVVLITYWHFRASYLFRLQGSVIEEGFLTLEDENDRLSRNVGKELPLLAAL